MNAGLPRAVRVREVGPRDGFQNEPELIATADKLELIELLGRTGVRRLELAAFVRADVIPQLADADAVVAGARLPADVAVSVLAPTPRGLDRALAHAERIDQVTVFLSASETHNRRNVNRSIADSLAGLTEMLPRIRAAGLRPAAAVSVAFGCPYEGHVAPGRVAEILRGLVDAGAAEVVLGDTTGMANPVSVGKVWAAVADAVGGEAEITCHFHNTRGHGLANVLAALEAGCESFDASFGEIGGCPVPAGATGNIATEDLVSMLHEMGVRTGIDLELLLAAGRRLREVLGRPLGSRTLVAGPVRWERAA